MRLPPSVQNLINEFSKLPGIGPKTSERLVFWLLRRSKIQIHAFAGALLKLSEEIHICPTCFNFTNNGNMVVCTICADAKRDRGTICVVAESLDLIAIESAGFNGLYHVLGGTVNPLKGGTLADLRFKELIIRLGRDVKELILAFDPNQEGELTCHYLKKALQAYPHIKITRLGRGLPQGGDLDYADEVTLTEALKGRREI